MFRKDYLMKLLQQLEEALKKINQKRREGDHEHALRLTKDSYQKLLGLQSTEMDSEEFINKLLENKSLEFDELNVLAELLKEEGDIHFDLENNKRSKLKYEQALEVFAYLNQEEKVFSFEREAKISEMQMRIQQI